MHSQESTGKSTVKNSNDSGVPTKQLSWNPFTKYTIRILGIHAYTDGSSYKHWVPKQNKST